ncbi:hypothetical protein MPH47_08485 [Psychrobacillus psychrodurans]|nr:hypothetical protein [Psychrobacillus psychrodurans]MCK1997256.1 hypothetical protein [Psychrobacillus psychrodurans]
MILEIIISYVFSMLVMNAIHMISSNHGRMQYINVDNTMEIGRMQYIRRN